MLLLDGSRGEGGGQILRTSLSLAAWSGRPFRLEKIRAGRSRPGLRPQHLTAVLAAAAVCGAELQGAAIGSTTLEFHPRHPPAGGDFHFDVAANAPGGSAGSATLVAQTILWPLAFAARPSRVMIDGGTHVPFSPSFHYLDQVTRPAYGRFGLRFDLALERYGWLPAGGGRLILTVEPHDSLFPAVIQHEPVERVFGLAVATNLPGHIPHRLARRADNLLAAAGLRSSIEARRERGPAPGAGIFLWLDGGRAGFDALGRPGLPAQTVAESAVADLTHFLHSGAAVDPHLADQLLLPMTLAAGRSRLTTSRWTSHAETNAALLRRWLGVAVAVAERGGVWQVEVGG